MGRSETEGGSKKERNAARKEKKALKKEKKEKKALKKERKHQNGTILKDHPKDVKNNELTWIRRKVVKKNALRSPRELSPAKNLVFFKKVLHLNVALLPSELANISDRVLCHIQQMLMKSFRGMGVLLAYEDVRISEDRNDQGRIIGELPFIHFYVTMTGLFFYPKIGCTLRGKIVSCLASHIGLKVMGCLTAVIMSEKLGMSSYVYDPENYAWQTISEDDDPTSGNKVSTPNLLSKNDIVDFVLDNFHEDRGFRMEGSQPIWKCHLSPPAAVVSEDLAVEEEDSMLEEEDSMVEEDS